MPPSYPACWAALTPANADEAGLLNGTIGSGTWGSGVMIDNNSTWTTTIPKVVPSGNYLIRFETIALHSLPAVSVPSNPAPQR